MPDLLPDGVRLRHHALDVVTLGGPLQHELLDLHLQLGVGPLQRTHLVQVVGQPVVQDLHGLLITGAQTIPGEGGAQDVEAVPHRDGAGQWAGGGQRGHGGFGPEASPPVPDGHAGQAGRTQRVAAHGERGGHGVHCRSAGSELQEDVHVLKKKNIKWSLLLMQCV